VVSGKMNVVKKNNMIEVNYKPVTDIKITITIPSRNIRITENQIISNLEKKNI